MYTPLRLQPISFASGRDHLYFNFRQFFSDTAYHIGPPQRLQVILKKFFPTIFLNGLYIFPIKILNFLHRYIKLTPVGVGKLFLTHSYYPRFGMFYTFFLIIKIRAIYTFPSLPINIS